MDCSPPGSSVHGISQTRTLEWVACFHLQGIFLIQGLIQVSCIAGGLSQWGNMVEFRQRNKIEECLRNLYYHEVNHHLWNTFSCILRTSRSKRCSRYSHSIDEGIEAPIRVSQPLLLFWTRWVFVMGGSPVPHRMLHNIPTLYSWGASRTLLPKVTQKMSSNVARCLLGGTVTTGWESLF